MPFDEKSRAEQAGGAPAGEAPAGEAGNNFLAGIFANDPMDDKQLGMLMPE